MPTYVESFEDTTSPFEVVSIDSTVTPASNAGWNKNSGTTSSTDTGPNGAYNGTYYQYVEASSPAFPSKEFSLQAGGISGWPGYPAHSPTAVSFYYHMFGATMGALYLEYSNNGGSTWSTVWSRSGQQHTAHTSSWSYSGTISIPNARPTTLIRFRGVTGSNYYSDMAIDYVNVTLTRTPPTVSNFTGSSPVARGSNALMSWTFVPGETGTTQSNYKFRYRKQGTSSWTETASVATSSSSNRPFSTGALEDAIYEVQVAVTDHPSASFGGWSSTALVDVQAAPQAPSNLSATPSVVEVGDEVIIGWQHNDPGADPQQKYQLRWRKID